MLLFGSSLRKISAILKECAQGQRILKAYIKEKELTERQRNKICDMIITDLENRHERYTFYLIKSFYKNMYILLFYINFVFLLKC